MAAEKNLLLGLLSLQNGLIQPAHLVAAFHAWTSDKPRSLADHLIALGYLSVAQRSVIEALAELHVQAHGGDVATSLAAVPADWTTRQSLADLGDPDIGQTLVYVAPGDDATEDWQGDADRTASYPAGSAEGGQRFRILRPHAQGGLGAVFVALDAELHREVALKQILDRHADDPTSRTRFLIEAEISGGLEHPGIVPVYGLGAYADGRPYYSMRFIRGDSLKEAAHRFHADLAIKKDPGRRSLELRKLLRRFTDVCNVQAKEVRQGMMAVDPTNRANRASIASCETKIAAALLAQSRLSESRASCQRALALREELVKGEPGNEDYARGLAETLLRSGGVKAAAGDAAGAAADWRRGAGLYAAHPPVKGEPVIFRACCHGALAGLAGVSGSGVSAVEAAEQARTAIAILREVNASGFRDADLLRAEPGLDPLRSRADFRLLMMDLDFPTEPFAR